MIRRVTVIVFCLLNSVLAFANPDDIISFARANVKAICVANWDTNGDGELSEAEAAEVGQV